MTSTLTANAVRGSTPRDAFPARFVRIAARFVRAVAAEWRSPGQPRELTSMSDHRLRDIGLARVRGVQVVRFGPFE